MLASSSIPLHLFYNSAVFSTLSANDYEVCLISPNLATGKYFNATWDHDSTTNLNMTLTSDLVNLGSDLMRNSENASIWQNMTNSQCLKEYGQEFVSTHGNLLAVSHALNDSNSIKYIDSGWPKSDRSAYSWMCNDYPDALYGQNSSQCRLSDILKVADNWTIGSDLVDYCLSLRMEENCRLQFSLAILILVIICNFVKAACMTLMVYQHDPEPLVTLGDAIASFLNEPDLATQGICIATKNDFRKSHWTAAANTWQPRQLRWFKNASLKRWLVCNSL